MKYYLLFALLIPFIESCGQSSTTDTTKRQVQIDAESMITSLVKQDFETYAIYIDPKLIEMQGGKEAFIAALKNQMKDFKFDYPDSNNFMVKNLSKEIKCGSELQCVFEQNVIMSYSGQKPTTLKSNLIGISEDNGKSWKFIDVSNKELIDIKKVFPNVCDSLPIK